MSSRVSSRDADERRAEEAEQGAVVARIAEGLEREQQVHTSRRS